MKEYPNEPVYALKRAGSGTPPAALDSHKPCIPNEFRLNARANKLRLVVQADIFIRPVRKSKF